MKEEQGKERERREKDEKNLKVQSHISHKFQWPEIKIFLIFLSIISNDYN